MASKLAGLEPRRAAVLCVLCVLSVQLGCVTSATLTTLEPAELDVRGMSRLAVLDFSGPDEYAQIARNTIVSQLQASGLYWIADPAELQRAAPASLYDGQGRLNRPAALAAAGRMRLDAILFGRILRRRDGQVELGGVTLELGDPTVTVTTEFELLDARTGQVLAVGQTEESYRGELTRDRTSSTSEQRVLKELVAASAAKVVAKFAPHPVPVTVPLASAAWGRGTGAILIGNISARAGQWPKAEQQWQAALDENPDSDAAMYNLGLAYEAANDLARAQEMFAAAARVKQKDLYREALQRVQTRDRELHVIAAQARGKNVGLPPRGTGLTGTPPEAEARNLPMSSPTNWSPDLRATSGDAAPSAAPTQPAGWMPASPSLLLGARRLPVDESPVR